MKRCDISGPSISMPGLISRRGIHFFPNADMDKLNLPKNIKSRDNTVNDLESALKAIIVSLLAC